MGRLQKQGLITKTISIRITDDLDKKINRVVKQKYKGGERVEDKSHLIRLALEDYFITYYPEV